MWSKNLRFALVFALAMTTARLCLAQEAKPERPAPKFYKLDFVVKEVDGKRVVNSRNYSIVAATDTSSSIRAKEQVRVQMGGTANVTQTVDVGTDIDTREIQQIQNDLGLAVTANVASPVSDAQPESAITRRFSWNSYVLIPLRKPTTIFSSDVTTGKTQMQLELTATPIL